MPGAHAHPPPEPIEQVISRLKDEQQHLRRSSKRRARARPRSAAQLSKTPLASAQKLRSWLGKIFADAIRILLCKESETRFRQTACLRKDNQ